MTRYKRCAALAIGAISLVQAAVGCARHQVHPSITAVGLSPANRCDPPGIPYYLPKPLLVVSKNVRHIDESKVGLTGPAPIPGGFDNQAAYADIKANVTVPSSPGSAGAAAANIPAANVSDATLSKATVAEMLDKSIVPEAMTPAAGDRFNGGVELDSFYTYQVIFVPDLTQKYGLQITGGAGEFRAAMNLVNGWMYTGMGPFYFKDSSSAQNAMATGVGAMYAGRGVADVVSSVGDLASTIARGKESALTDEQLLKMSSQLQALEALARSTPKVAQEMLNYAEIYIYEPHVLPDQTTEWRLVAEHHFDRHYFDQPADPAAIQAKQEVMQSLLQGIIGTEPKSAPTTPPAPAPRATVPAAPSVPAQPAPFQPAPFQPAPIQPAPAGVGGTPESAVSDLDAGVDIFGQPQPGGGRSTQIETGQKIQNFVPAPGLAPIYPAGSQVEINVMPGAEPATVPSRVRHHFQRQPPTNQQRTGNQTIHLQ